MGLLAEADAPARARAAVTDSMGDDSRADVAALATSEIVTNALVHGGLDPGEQIELTISHDDGVVRIEVLNPADRPLAAADLGPSPPSPDQFGGWGLGIVATVSARWGVDHTDGHTLVWFVI